MSDRLVKKVAQLAEEQATPVKLPVPSKPHLTRSLKIAQRGLRTGFDTIDLLTATITDVLEEEITTNQANVVVNATGKVLKVVELQMKYGKAKPDGERDLILIGSGSTAAAAATP